MTPSLFSAQGISSRRLALAAALATVVTTISLAGCAMPQPSGLPSTERSVLLQRMDGVLRQAQATGAVQLVARPDPVTTGQLVQLEVRTAQPGYLYLYQISTDGTSLSLAFPNAMDGANYLPAGQTALPRASWQLRARGPAGVGYLLAVLTPQPLDLMTLQAQLQAGQFLTPGAYSAALATLRETAPQ